MPYFAIPAVRQWLSPALFLAAASIAGCGPADDRSTPDMGETSTAAAMTTPPSCTPPWTGRIETVPRADVVAWAGGLSYGEPDTTRARLSRFEGTAAMHLVGGLDTLGLCLPTAGGCFIARVITNQAQPRLGIAAGTNYVWADSAGGSGRVVIIPQNTEAPLVVLRLRHHRYELGAPAPAAGVAPGGCGWCGDHCWCDWTSGPTGTAIQRLPGKESLAGVVGGREPTRGGPGGP